MVDVLKMAFINHQIKQKKNEMNSIRKFGSLPQLAQSSVCNVYVCVVSFVCLPESIPQFGSGMRFGNLN